MICRGTVGPIPEVAQGSCPQRSELPGPRGPAWQLHWRLCWEGLMT